MTYIELKELFEQNRDEEQAVSMKKYMRDQFEFYGIPTPKRKSIYKEFLKGEQRNKKIDWNLLDLCFQDEYREFQYFVIDYLKTMRKYLKYEDIEKLKKYIQMKSWWDTVDGFDAIIGAIGLNDNRVNDLMLEYSKDEDFWIRRLSIDHQLGRKEKTNVDLLEQIIMNNLGTDEFFINKAIGWSLRDYSKTNPKWVKSFVEKHQDKMHTLSVKEAKKYIGE